ncbi:YfhD family protein [Bacillus changyiensis]|uniref:YfhD family protein n=1 Tax=Bacillus changyiensis TaxID=3004103 RepID=UPI0022E54AC2|nr:YfhD family protein [Bacillus changyiensis]MDA1478330.1 YfhD family protein [Bacillus changyiensis]
MGRNSIHKNRDKNKQKLPQVPDQYKKETDGVYEEYAAELADQDDREAQARAQAADSRAKQRMTE